MESYRKRTTAASMGDVISLALASPRHAMSELGNGPFVLFPSRVDEPVRVSDI